MRPGLIHGGSAIGGLGGAGPDPPTMLMFLRYQVANQRRSFRRRSHPLTIFCGPQSRSRSDPTSRDSDAARADCDAHPAPFHLADVLFAGDQKPNAIAVTSRTFAANIRMATASGRRISVDMAGDPPSDPGKLTIHRICSGRAGPAAMLAPGNPKRGGVQRLGPQDSTRRVGHLEGLSHRQADSRTSSKSSEALD